MGKLPGEDFAESLMVNPIETLFEKLPGFLSNTISYGRLGVLLVVHAALMIATNAALNLGVAGIALAIICNTCDNKFCFIKLSFISPPL